MWTSIRKVRLGGTDHLTIDTRLTSDQSACQFAQKMSPVETAPADMSEANDASDELVARGIR